MYKALGRRDAGLGGRKTGGQGQNFHCAGIRIAEREAAAHPVAADGAHDEGGHRLVCAGEVSKIAPAPMDARASLHLCQSQRAERMVSTYGSRCTGSVVSDSSAAPRRTFRCLHCRSQLSHALIDAAPVRI